MKAYIREYSWYIWVTVLSVKRVEMGTFRKTMKWLLAVSFVILYAPVLSKADGKKSIISRKCILQKNNIKLYSLVYLYSVLLHVLFHKPRKWCTKQLSNREVSLLST